MTCDWVIGLVSSPQNDNVDRMLLEGVEVGIGVPLGEEVRARMSFG